MGGGATHRDTPSTYQMCAYTQVSFVLSCAAAVCVMAYSLAAMFAEESTWLETARLAFRAQVSPWRRPHAPMELLHAKLVPGSNRRCVLLVTAL